MARRSLATKLLNSISYPYGAFNEKISKKSKRILTINMVSLLDLIFIMICRDSLCIPRIDIWDSDDIQTFQKKTEGKWNWMRFFLNTKLFIILI